MSKIAVKRREGRIRRHRRVRKKIVGTTERPRLCVKRSLKHMSAQIVDDTTMKTLVSVTSVSKELQGKLGDKSKIEASKMLGVLVAEKAKAAGISQVAFDRGGFVYHGRIKALADGAREGGLEF
ncbi:MAG: 50S ribosomal protein L18 [Candidatus Eisenbacteria bacterium]|uniref:Large ribosomal subunit protein uL18 n=1 Tax=Eiseniibacteriota bacterium TaxID=2212470 RepID=A0A7Y2E677_UNCEI|nr:50S ribosomal protein L18 [Candidatus Eisenbacteria bacterium]